MTKTEPAERRADGGTGGRSGGPTVGDLLAAIESGAVNRLRPKLMTVAAIMLGLLPALWSHGTGAEVMRRIAAPMVGGMVTSTVLTLVVIPVIYFLWRRRSIQVHRRLLALRDRYFPELAGRAPSAEWVGPLAFTPDQLPAIGFLRPGVIIAAGFNGYGGSYTTAAGLAAVEMARTGAVPEWVPADTFSPRRLMSTQPMFMAQRDSLWRIAASLCRQLTAVNERIADALTLLAEPPDAVQVRRSRMMMAIAESEDASDVPPESLGAFSLFKTFTPVELKTLLAAMRRWEVRKGTVLFAEGAPGDSCFVVLSGVVEVSLRSQG